ncbi:MAG: Sulfate transporter/antisigma-factor antagonist [Planctomycetaceae bacterium]|nr:Sulfate transporter/antisigma-factor antagonist [Planctomycetaceae bacterium]
MSMVKNFRSGLGRLSGAVSVESHESPYQFDRFSNYASLTLNPLINEGQWSNVSEVGNEILNQIQGLAVPSLVVDLSRLNYMGSPQLALLVRIWKSLKKLPGQMAVHCPSPAVREILCTAGLRSLWDIVETHDAALKSLGVPLKPRPAISVWNWFCTNVFRLVRLRPS